MNSEDCGVTPLSSFETEFQRLISIFEEKVLILNDVKGKEAEREERICNHMQHD